MTSYENLRHDSEILHLIDSANDVLGAIGFTEHGRAHCVKTGTDASRILETLGYSEKECELAKIAGLLHDTGNAINRCDHAQSGAFLAFQLLKDRDFPFEDIVAVTTAIGHHDEKTAAPVTPLAAALILADKSDVRTSRVRNKNDIYTDIHDRVNYAVTESKLTVIKDRRLISLSLKLTHISAPLWNILKSFSKEWCSVKNPLHFSAATLNLLLMIRGYCDV